MKSTARIEVKVKRHPTAIGHMIAGHARCSEPYGVSPARLTIVCGVGDAALEWVDQQRGMLVSTRVPRPYPHQHTADQAWAAALLRPAHA